MTNRAEKELPEKKKRVKTPSFVVELPLATFAEDEKWLLDRISCASRLHNVLLQAGIAMVDAMRAHPDWLKAKTLRDMDARRRLYELVKEQHNFNSAHFDKLVAINGDAAGFAGRIGSHEMQALAKRVFNALSKWVYGKGGRPRFKGAHRKLHSIEGKNNLGMLRWDAENKTLLMQRGWSIKAILPRLDIDEWLWSALQFETKYCRVLWRMVGGKRRWYVQLIQRGVCPIKASFLESLAPAGSVGGIDLGPSTVAWCTATNAANVPLCPEIDRPEKEIRTLQRSIERKRRFSNPDNYNKNGTIRKGPKKWKTSGRLHAEKTKLADLQRSEAATRKCSHGKLVNALLREALNWKDDGVSPLALQKNYGKSISKKAPGLLMSELTRKAERAGGSRSKIDVRNLKTSQYDHSTDDFLKKKLSQRWHYFRDGRGRVQRDVYSAFLACHSEGNRHDPSGLKAAWTTLESTLRGAGLCDDSRPKEEATLPHEQTSPVRRRALPVIPNATV